jgi:hypothetical protein
MKLSWLLSGRLNCKSMLEKRQKTEMVFIPARHVTKNLKEVMQDAA